MLKTLCLLTLGTLICFAAHSQTTSIASFTAPDTVCVNAPVGITNTSTGAGSYYWNFCVANLNSPPTGVNLGNVNNGMSSPVYVDYVQDNGNYYGFVTDNHTGKLLRLDFGNNLLNTPALTDLGTLGGVVPGNTEGIQVIKNEGKWYAIIVGGDPDDGHPSRIIKVEFGTNIANAAPAAFDWGNIGNLDYPHDLYVFSDNGTWYGLTVNTDNNTITRFNFTNSFSNTPTGVNLGNIGNLVGPTGIHAIADNGKWYAFITNANSHTLTRLDFGNSLLNVPTGTNLGNINGVFHNCWDIYVIKYCGELLAYIINANQSYNDIIKLNFKNDITSLPTAVSFGNIGNLYFPHCLSKIFRVGADLYTFIPNVDNQTLSRLQFTGCTNASIPNSTAQNPPAVTYNVPGTYNINLTIDDGLPTQASFCRQVVVVPEPVADFSYTQDPCNPNIITFKNESTTSQTISWDFGNGITAGNLTSPIVTYASFGTYTVQLSVKSAGSCIHTVTKQITTQYTLEDVIITKDTTVCSNVNLQLQAVPALSYCWTPATGLSSATIANPVAAITGPIKYFLTTQTTGNNLIANGDFSLGNTGFTSDYTWSNSGVNPGVYFTGANPVAWHPAMPACKDHTSGNGNMLLVNGAQQTNVKVWSQNITISPNTNYAFSAWLQHITTVNPAQLQFSINGKMIGNIFQANSTNCIWEQFYAIWNSGNSTTATISIVNMNAGFSGNDFALDDLSFAPVLVKRDSVVISLGQAIVKASNDTTICGDRPVPLSANGGLTYTWSPATGLSNAAISNPIAIPATTTQYIVTGATSFGCTGKDTVNITVMGKPAILAVHDTLICPDMQVQLQANPGLASYVWSPGATLNNSNIADPVASPDQATKYTVEIKDANNCTYKDSVEVQIRSIQFAASPDQAICEGSSVTLNASGGDMYVWTPSDLVDDAQSGSPVATPQQTTQYSVHIAENACGQDTTIQMNITVNPGPIVTAQKSNDINCTVPTSQLQAQGADTYLWAPAAGVNDPNKPNPIAAVDTTTLFYVRGANQFGCIGIDSIRVTVTAAGKENFVVPNAFTPNGDYHNDCIGIKRWGPVVIEEFSIYSRWGERVFTTNDPSQCWNGYYKGKLMDNGAYAYVIKAKTFCGHMKRTGIIMLIR